MIVCHCFFGGFLPFSAISVELYYIFATVWGREQYTLYGVLMLVFIIVLSVSACISIALTYFQVCKNNYLFKSKNFFFVFKIFSVVLRRLSMVVEVNFLGRKYRNLCFYLFLLLLFKTVKYVRCSWNRKFYILLIFD